MQAVFVRHFFALFFPFFLGIYLVPIIIKAAKKIGFMDSPDGRLKIQKKPIPYLGGIAVFVPFIATLGLCYPFENEMLWLLLGTTLLLFVGLVDDLKALRPGQKFFAQGIAVLSFLKGCFSLKNDFFHSFFNLCFSAFWMLSVINAFNLVDVMDGLCVTLAMCASLAFGVIAFSAGKYTVSLLLAAFFGSLAGFFVYNKPQAKIYLGDAGSLFIGGFFAAMPLLFDWRAPGLSAQHFLGTFFTPLLEVFFIPSLVLAVPLIEVVSLFIIRTSLGLRFYNGSPHHFSLYLQRKGWSRWAVLGFAMMFAFVFAAVAFLFCFFMISKLFFLTTLCLLLVLWSYIVFYL